MDAAVIEKLRTTSIAILKARIRPHSVGLLLGARWEVVRSENPYADDEAHVAYLYLPPVAYAAIDASVREQSEEEIRETLAEVMVPMAERIDAVRVVPELVETLSESQEELVRWWTEEASVIHGELVAPDFDDDDDIPF